MRGRVDEDFWRDQREQLVGVIGSYCGDDDLAEDLVHDALVRASENWDDLGQMDSPGGWLYRVAVNVTHSHFRRRRIGQRVLEQLGSAEQWVVEPDPAVRVALLRALETLPHRQRAAVTLRFLLDWSVADVAVALGVSENTVKSLTHRGVGRLRTYFEETPGSESRVGRTVAGGLVVLVVAVAAAVAWGMGAEPAPIYIDPPPERAEVEVEAPAMSAEEAVAKGCPTRGDRPLLVSAGEGAAALFVLDDRARTCHIADVNTPGVAWMPFRSLEAFDRGEDVLIVDGSGAQKDLSEGGHALVLVHGRVGAGVDTVVVTLTDGSEVEAVRSDGFFLAVWPRWVDPERILALDADGDVLVDRVVEGMLDEAEETPDQTDPDDTASAPSGSVTGSP